MVRFRFENFYCNNTDHSYYHTVPVPPSERVLKEVSVKIDEFFQSCQLCITRNPYPRIVLAGTVPLILKLNLEPFQSFVRSVRSVNHEESSTTSSGSVPLPEKNKNSDREIVEPSSVLVIINGEFHQTDCKNSTWTTAFLLRSANADLKINILIDFPSTSLKTNSKHVLDHLLNLWETKLMADVTFKFISPEDKDIQAHSLILTSACPVLAAMFQNDLKEKQERVVVIKDSKPAVFEKMLRFFYSGDANLDKVDVTDLLILAEKYGVDSLKKECVIFMSKNLTVDHAIRYLVVAHLHELPNLCNLASDFISRNAEEIIKKQDWKDLMKNHLELGLEVVQKIVLVKK